MCQISIFTVTYVLQTRFAVLFWFLSQSRATRLPSAKTEILKLEVDALDGDNIIANTYQRSARTTSSIALTSPASHCSNDEPITLSHTSTLRAPQSLPPSPYPARTPHAAQERSITQWRNSEQRSWISAASSTLESSETTRSERCLSSLSRRGTLCHASPLPHPPPPILFQSRAGLLLQTSQPFPPF